MYLKKINKQYLFIPICFPTHLKV